jgi:hypothetical protein
MMNLADDIAEMFGELDGGSRYEQAIVEWSAWRLADQRRRDSERSPERNRQRNRSETFKAYRREYDKQRRSIPVVRARQVAAQADYRNRRFGHQRRTYGPLQLKHGTYHAYQARGCRCQPCREATRDYAKLRRAARKAA